MNDASKNAAAAALPKITLKAGEQRRVLFGHPWVYSNEIAMDAAAKALPPGRSSSWSPDGRALGTATFNPRTLIAARLLSREPADRDRRAFLAARLQRALALRRGCSGAVLPAGPCRGGRPAGP